MHRFFSSIKIKNIISLMILVGSSLSIQARMHFSNEVIKEAFLIEKETLVSDKHPNIIRIQRTISNNRITKKHNKNELDNKYGLFALACIIGSFVIFFTAVAFANIATISAITVAGAYAFLIVFTIGAVLAYLGQKRDKNPRLAKRVWEKAKNLSILVLVIMLFII